MAISADYPSAYQRIVGALRGCWGFETKVFWYIGDVAGHVAWHVHGITDDESPTQQHDMQALRGIFYMEELG
jgi:hypothetical protein